MSIFCYPRWVSRPVASIMTAATLRQTAAADASAKSEIHMARLPSFCSNFALVIFERIINVPAPNLFLELCD
jgi:hypothetical protein